MNGKLSIIIISIILVITSAAVLTVQSSSPSSMLQPSYAQSCPEGAPVDASGNCPTDAPPPAGDGETTQAPPAGDGETQAPAATTETPPSAAPPANASQVSNNTGTMTADWANSILAVHNNERAAVRLPPLAWSEGLAANAQTWAEHVSQTGVLANSGPGENIAGFLTDPTEPTGGTSLWVAEKQNWHGGALTNENRALAGHYTQMVWYNTQYVGCGAAPPGAGGLPYSILVCQYYPVGNLMGYAPY